MRHVLLLLLFTLAAALDLEQLRVNKLVLDSATAAIDEGITSTSELETNATLLAVPCQVITPSPICIQFCHNALADPSLESQFDFRTGVYNPFWSCVFGIFGVTIPSTHTKALELQAILSGAGSLSVPRSNSGACRAGYTGTPGNCVVPPANHLVVASDLSRDWGASTVLVSVPCPPLSESHPVPLTLCTDPSTASSRGCADIPVYATQCVLCPVTGGEGLFGFRSQTSQLRCQPGMWGQQPTVRAGSNVAEATSCGSSTYQHAGPALALLDPNTAGSLDNYGDVPRAAMGLCLECEAHHSSDGQQCEPCPSNKYRALGVPQCLDCPQPTGQSVGGGPCVGCPAGWVPTLAGSCKPCVTPKLAISYGASTCSECPSDQVPLGSYMALPPVIRTRSASGAVIETPDNTSLPFSSTQCIGYPLPHKHPCPPGYGFGQHRFCILCWTGTYSDGSKCTPCAIGTFSNTAGRTSACTTQCSAGSAPKSNVAELLTGAWGTLPLHTMTANWFGLPFSQRLNSTYAYNVSWSQIAPYAAAVPSYIPSTISNLAEYIALATSIDPAVSCAPCEPGTYAKPGMSGCAPCTGSTFIAPSAGMSACVACPTGLYATPNKTHCLLPESQNMYPSRNASLVQPLACNNVPGYIEITSIPCVMERCPDGSQPLNRTHCGPCTAGTYGRGGLCLPCARGFVSQSNSTQCTACGGNTVATSEGLAQCTPCGPGQISNGRYCRDCLVNFEPAPDFRSCARCPPTMHRPQGVASCMNCTGLITRSGTECVQCEDLLFYDKNCTRCADTHLSPQDRCERAPMQPRTNKDSNLRDSILTSTGLKPVEGEYRYLSKNREYVFALAATIIAAGYMLLHHRRDKRGQGRGRVPVLAMIVACLPLATAITPGYSQSPAYEPLPVTSTLDNIAYLQAQAMWSLTNGSSPTLAGKLNWQSRLISESAVGSGAIIDPEYDRVYMHISLPAAGDRRFITYAASVLGTLGPMCRQYSSFCIEMCCAVSDHMRAIVGSNTMKIADAFLQAWGWCAFQPLSSAQKQAMQTVDPCDAFGDRSKWHCAILSSPYSLYAGAPPSASDTGPKQCKLGYYSAQLLTRGGIQLYPCIPAWGGQLSPPLGSHTLYPDSWTSLDKRVDMALPTQYTAFCPPGYTTDPPQATTCSASLRYDPTFEGLFVCPGGCCGETTAAFGCKRCDPPDWVDPYTGNCVASLSPNPVVLPHRLLGISGYYERVTLPVNIPVPVMMQRAEPATPCPVDHELINSVCVPCLPNHYSTGTGLCSPCTGNTYRHEVYANARTISCVLAEPHVNLWAFETTVVDRTPIRAIANGTELKLAMSPVRRASCANVVNTGCVASPPGFSAMPGSDPVRCPAHSVGPHDSYIGFGFPRAPCSSCPRRTSYTIFSTGLCHQCGYTLGTIGYVQPGSMYAAGEWISEIVENSTVAAQRWNNPQQTRIESPTQIGVFYSELPGGVWASACANSTTMQQGREFVENTHVLCPAGTFQLGFKCYACPDGSWSGIGARTCTLIESGYQMPSIFPYRDYMNNLSIPLFEMADRCNSSLPDVLGCTSTHSWKLPFRPNVTALLTGATLNVTTTLTGNFTLLAYMQDTGMLRTHNRSATPCPPGTHSQVFANCRKCPENTYQPNPAASSCLQCPPNTFSNFTIGATHCVPCTGPNATCILPANDPITGKRCQPGQFVTMYEPAHHLVFCQRCPADSISTQVDALRCTKCVFPQVPSPDQTYCRYCPDPFRPNPTTGQCDRCPDNYRADNTTQCRACPPGFERPSSATHCIPCTNHLYSNVSGSACTVCPPNTQSNIEIRATYCVPCEGRNVRFGTEPTCHLCTDGSIFHATGGPDGAHCSLCPFLTVGGNNSVSNRCTPCDSPNSIVGATVCLDKSDSPLTRIPDSHKDQMIYALHNRLVLVLTLVGIAAVLGGMFTMFRHRPRIDDPTIPEVNLPQLTERNNPG